MKRADGRRVCDGSPESMHGAAGAPPQLTDGACVAAQSTDVAALRHTLQAQPLALRLPRERAIGAKSTDLCAVDFHVGRAQRADNRGSRMLSRTRAHRASGGPGGGRPSSPPETSGAGNPQFEMLRHLKLPDTISILISIASSIPRCMRQPKMSTTSLNEPYILRCWPEGAASQDG